MFGSVFEFMSSCRLEKSDAETLCMAGYASQNVDGVMLPVADGVMLPVAEPAALELFLMDEPCAPTQQREAHILDELMRGASRAVLRRQRTNGKPAGVCKKPAGRKQPAGAYKKPAGASRKKPAAAAARGPAGSKEKAENKKAKQKAHMKTTRK